MISLKDIQFSKGDVVEIDGEVMIYAGKVYAGEEVGFAAHKFWDENHSSIDYLGVNNTVKSFRWIKRPSHEIMASHLGITVEQVDEMFSPENVKRVLEAVAEDMKKSPKW